MTRLWIVYGDPAAPHRILVDGGTSDTSESVFRCLEDLPVGDRRVDLVVVTHIDADHIDGIVTLLENDTNLAIDDIWFNGFPHLPEEHEVFGPIAGERLTKAILDRNQTWNGSRPFGPAIAVADLGAPVSHKLAGGLRMTVLSPGRAQLAALRPGWSRVVREAGLDPEAPASAPEELPGWETLGSFDFDALKDAPFAPDRSVANGTTIALLAEYTDNGQEVAVLLAGDAHADVLEDSLDRLLALRESERLELDAFKLPHHGSKKNVSRRMVEQVSCPRFIFSSNGAYYRHPDREAVARVIAYGQRPESGPQLLFNYRTRFNDVWDDPHLMERHRYRVSYPEAASPGIVIDLA